MVEKIISGGQTGADRGGLLAARLLGIPTGGTAPKGWITERGPDPELGTVYGLVESTSSLYTPRTRQNVLDADGTVIFGNIGSRGSAQTLAIARGLGRPVIVNPSVNALRKWISVNNIKVLNVAGNRESRNPGLQAKVVSFLTHALKGATTA
jgi:hypothetical protein